MKTEEKRKYHRYPYNNNVLVYDQSRQFQHFTIDNISKGGLCVRSPEPVPQNIGGTVIVNIIKDLIIRSNFECKWKYFDNDKHIGLAGFEFTNLSTKYIDIIDNLISELSQN